MFTHILISIKNKLRSRGVKKVKPLILKYAYNSRIYKNSLRCYIELLVEDTKINNYSLCDFSIIKQAINELNNEKKIIYNDKDEIHPYFTLTDATFQYLSQNTTPIKNWLQNNIINILNFIVALWGAITGTLSLFFKN